MRCYWLGSFGIVVLSIICIVILYIKTSSNNFSLNSIKLQGYFSTNGGYSSTPRILCLIITMPKNLLTYVKAVNETWALRCDRHFFVTENLPQNASSKEVNFLKELPILPIKDITPGPEHHTAKTVKAFLFAYENYFKAFDWFVRAEDDTYLIVEHLKMFLSDKKTSTPVTYGYNYKTAVPSGYHDGGASYVLSREALRRFHEAHQDPKSECAKDGGDEYVEVAKCLRSKGVYPGKSLDKQNRELFHPLTFNDHFRPPEWLSSIAENPVQSGYDCCSDRTISFHQVPPDLQYTMDFFLYRTRSPPDFK